MVAPLQKRQDIIRSTYYAIVHCLYVGSDGTIEHKDIRVNGRRNSVRAYMEEARQIDISCIPQNVTAYRETGVMDVETFVACCRKLTRTETHELPLT